MLLNHLVRKKPCKSVLKEISNMEILKMNKIEEYNKEKYKLSKSYPSVIQKLSNCNPKVIQNDENVIPKLSTYKCKYCDKEYKYRSGKCKHEKKCCVKKEKENKNNSLQNQLDDMKKKINAMESENEKQAKEINKLKKLNDKQEKIINNITNNTNNTNNYYINFHNFGKHPTDYLTKEEINDYVKNPFKNCYNYLEEVFFNKKYPANQNIRLYDLKSGVGKMFIDNKWSDIPLNIWTDKILYDSITTLMTSANSEIDYNNDDNFLKYEEMIKSSNNDVMDDGYDSDKNNNWSISDGINKEKSNKNKKRVLEKLVKSNALKLTSKLERNYKKLLSKREFL
jgi:hypothetical protein